MSAPRQPLAPQQKAGATSGTATWQRLGLLPDWLVAITRPELVSRTLRNSVPELATGLLDLRGCTVHRVRLKGECWTAQYRLVIGEPGTGLDKELVLQGTLFPPRISPPAPESSSAPLGADNWHIYLPGLRLALEPQPPDADLPALPYLTDPTSARDLLEEHIRQAGPVYRDLQLERAEPHVVRYNPGSRCTVLYHLEYPPGTTVDSRWPRIVVAKTYHRDKGRQAYEAMRALWDSPLSTGDLVALAEPLAFIPSLNVLVQGPVVEEETLQDLIRAALKAPNSRVVEKLDGYLRKTAAGLAALHSAAVQARASRGWEDELAEVLQVNRRLESAIPELAGALAPLLEHLRTQAAAHPADPPAPVHGTFRPAQVLLDRGRIGFIDFDSFCMAEPALDVALFLEKIKDLGLSVGRGEPEDQDDEALDPAVFPERLAQVESICSTFLGAYAEHRPISSQRVALWETLYLLTLVLHCWTKVKPVRLVHGMFLLEHHLRTNNWLAGSLL